MDMNELRKLSGIPLNENEQLDEAANTEKVIKSTMDDIIEFLNDNKAYDAGSALSTGRKRFMKDILGNIKNKNLKDADIRRAVIEYIRVGGIFRVAVDKSKWDKFLNESLTEAKTAGKNGIDIGGMSVTKVGKDTNGNWSYWIKSSDAKSAKKIQTTNLHGGSGKVVDINDFKKLTPDAKQAIKWIKEYLNESLNEGVFDKKAYDAVVRDLRADVPGFGSNIDKLKGGKALPPQWAYTNFKNAEVELKRITLAFKKLKPMLKGFKD